MSNYIYINFILQKFSDTIFTGSTNPKKWIIHMEGGGYCSDEKDCLKRSFTDLGSSKQWPSTRGVSGFLSDDCNENPHFCGWTVAFIPYCDGGVYSGNV